MSHRRLPEGYGAHLDRGVVAFASEAAMDWLEGVLGVEGSLGAWGARHEAGRLQGRGPVYVVPAAVPGPDRRSRWAVRHYRRGGAAARLFGDRYWGTGRTRPELELEASLHARASGIRTPGVIAGAVYRAGPSAVAGFYRADLVTELVPDARSLLHILFETPAPADATAALREAGRLARSLERAGMLHPDLNAGNVVIDDAGETWVLDLDRCRRLPGPSRRAGVAMLKRLERSLRKLGIEHGRPLACAGREALRAGFDSAA